MSPFFYFYCFLKTLKMAFNTSSCIKISDTKICPHCTASTLIKNGLLLTKNNNFIVKHLRNGVLIGVQEVARWIGEALQMEL